MARYITVDGGTTNTRVSLVSDGVIVGTKKFSIGARVGIDDKSAQSVAIKRGIEELLSENSLRENDITKILASGMITSEFGLVKLDHLTAPVGIAELSSAMHEQIFPEISSIPFVFVRGVKTVGTLDKTDMMRGEETELYGISDGGECVYVLPGSHSKIIYMNVDGKIESFSTMLTGEMIAAISSSTILKDAVNLSSEIDSEYLKLGSAYAEENGINEALFKVRILKNLFALSQDKVYSFFLGVILSGEIKKVCDRTPRKIVIAGKEQLKAATLILLREKCKAEIIALDEKTASEAVIRGLIKIYEYKN